MFWDSKQEKANKRIIKAANKEAKVREKQIKELRKNPKNFMPKTYEEYVERSKSVPRSERIVTDPVQFQDPKITNVEDPHIRLTKYNNPPGCPEIDLKKLKKLKHINAGGVASPDMTKMVFSSVYFYPGNRESTSEIFKIDLDQSVNNKQKILKANVIMKDIKPLLSTGFDNADKGSVRTLIPLDWNYNSDKIAIKEKIGSMEGELWKTNLWVYDFNTQQAKQLNEIREAIKYYWLRKENIHLDQYLWDIFPLGWDANEPDRIIVLGYITTKKTPKYLGAWSIDYKGTRSKLMSLTQLGFEINVNGISAMPIIHE